MNESHAQNAQLTTLKRVQRVLWIVLLLNLLVAMAKLLYGTITGAASMQADGIHSFFDSTGNIIGLIGIHFAAKPADTDHPYGHRKYETYASTAIGVLLLVAGTTVAVEAIGELISGVSNVEVTPVSFIVMIGTLAVNLSVTTYEHRQAVKLNSEVLAADASHTLSDVFVTVGVIVGLVFVQFGFTMVDPIAALIVSIIIFYTAFGVFRTSAATFSDKVRIPAGEVAALIKSHGEVAECHEVRTRGTADAVYLDCHILVDPDWTVSRAHALATHLENDLKAAHPELVDVMIHVEPDVPEEREN